MGVKIDTDAIITRVRLQEQSSNPSAPSSGFGFLYEKTDQQLYMLNASGTATNIYHMGSAFPGSPVNGEQFYRVDRNLMYYYDGTRWLSVELFRETFFPSDNANPTSTSGAALGGWPTKQGNNGIWIVNFEVSTLVSTTNNGSNFWTVLLRWITAGNVVSTLTSFDTSADTATNWVDHSVSINALLDSTARLVRCETGTKTGTPGQLWVYPAIVYRLVG